MKKLHLITAMAALCLTLILFAAPVLGEPAGSPAAQATPGAEQSPSPQPTTGGGFSLLSILYVGAGLYMVISAVTGRGAMYKNENIKEGKEEVFKKTIRICMGAVGLLLLIMGVLDLVSVRLGIWETIIWLVGIAILIFMMIFTNRMTDKEKFKSTLNRKPDISAAFEFDEEEDTETGKGGNGE